MAEKWPGSLGQFGFLRIRYRFEFAKLKSGSRDGEEFVGGSNFVQYDKV